MSLLGSGARWSLFLMLAIGLQLPLRAAAPAPVPEGEPILETLPPPPPPIPTANASAPANLSSAAKSSPVSHQEILTIMPPSAPQEVSAVAQLIASTQGVKPTIYLQWKASRPGTYLIKGYRVWRKEPGDAGDGVVREGAPFVRSPAEDLGELGKTYQYMIAAVDAKGNTGPRSEPLLVRLDTFSVADRAPRLVQGLSAVSGRREVHLTWQAPVPWVAPVTDYLIRRSSIATVMGANALVAVTGTTFVDAPPTPKQIYFYTVSARDSEGRESVLGLTVTGQATGTLPPGAPQALTAKARGEKLTLSWERPVLGTAPLSAYLLRRRFADAKNTEESAWEKSLVKNLSATSHTYSSESNRIYQIELTAIDTEGVASVPATGTARVAGLQFNKTAVLLMPTAYTNHKDKDTGWNSNVLFDFYVGSLYEIFDNPRTGVTKTGIFQPIQIATVTSDFKYSFLKETTWTPSLAAGFYGSALINFGQPSGTQTVGVSSSGGPIGTVGDVYLVTSKRPWVNDQSTAFHLGVMRGRLADDLSRALPASWELTIRHLTPGGDFPDLLTRLVDPRIGAKVNSAPNMFFGGVQFPLTVPLGFTRWRTGARIELLRPALQNFGLDLTEKEKTDAESLLPTMINFRIENLPLFGFEFSIFQYLGGFQWIAFYHVPDLSWSF